jgi:HEAT repeat protein
MLWRRRPDVLKLARKGDSVRLVRALAYRDCVSDHRGRVFDLGAPVRRDAALALAAIAPAGGPDIDEALIRALRDPSAEVRRAVATALGARGDPRAVPALMDAALTWERPHYDAARAAAIEALAGLREPSVVATLVMTVVDRADEIDRGIEILARLVSSDTGGGRQLALTTAGAVMSDRNGDAAERAAEIVVWLGAGSVDMLIELLERQGPRLPTIRALGRLRDLRATEPLSALLLDGRAEVRRAAALALGQTSDPRARNALLDASSDLDPGVREAALAAVQKLGPPLAIDPEIRTAPGGAPWS